jgi:hypothetical protein
VRGNKRRVPVLWIFLFEVFDFEVTSSNSFLNQPFCALLKSMNGKDDKHFKTPVSLFPPFFE